jgi:peptidase E
MNKIFFNKNIYILIGGGCHNVSARNKLSGNIVSWIDIKGVILPTVLFIPFAKKRVSWGKTIEKYKKSFLGKLIALSGKVFIASTEIEKFKKQLAEADVIFIAGGSELSLKKYFKNVVIPAKNKIIIGTSAGVNILSSFYFSNDRQKVETGIGLLPIKTICHYSDEKHKFLECLTNKMADCPTLPISENEYVIFIM